MGVTEYFELPGGRVPFESKGPLGPGSTVPLGSGSKVPLDSPGGVDGGGYVQFTPGEWKNRQAVAENAAAELEAVGKKLELVAVRNSFGDLQEGRDLHARVTALVREWCRGLDLQKQELRALATRCSIANAELHGADVSSASRIIC